MVLHSASMQSLDVWHHLNALSACWQKYSTLWHSPPTTCFHWRKDLLRQHS